MTDTVLLNTFLFVGGRGRGYLFRGILPLLSFQRIKSWQAPDKLLCLERVKKSPEVVVTNSLKVSGISFNSDSRSEESQVAVLH